LILLVVLAGSLPLLALLSRDRLATRQLLPLLPFVAFVAWAVGSVLWTPLPAVTLGQAGGLAGLLLMSAYIALTYRQPDQVAAVFRTLVSSLLCFSGVVLVVHFLAPSFSGLDRRMLVAGSEGVVHPTAAGANASLGLLLATLCHFVGGFPGARRRWVCSLLVHGLVLYYASSRMAWGMALITVPTAIFFFSSNRLRALAVLTGGLLALGAMLSDPAFQRFFDADNAGLQYLTRGQSSAQLQGFSGRDEMWQAIGSEFAKAPLRGHGYFVTSAKGELEVWGMTANYTAHNIYLQVLASTGLIGFVLFVLAVVRPFCEMLRQLPRPRLQCEAFPNRIAIVLGFVLFWFFGWSLLCSSFMGPVRSESVVFFTCVGIGVGQLQRQGAQTG
jgi:O-antigen ligase